MKIIRTGVFKVNTIVVPCGEKQCFVVDPAACGLSGDENIIVDYLKKEKMECVGILLTHSHFDHVTGILPIKKTFPKAEIIIHESEFSELQNPPGPMNTEVIKFFGALELLNEVGKQPAATKSVTDGDFVWGWKVIHTPGHTPGSICLYNNEEGSLISGDTMFDYGGYGRTDMAGGNEAQIMHSLERLHKEIPAGTKVFPGHDSFGFSM